MNNKDQVEIIKNKLKQANITYEGDIELKQLFDITLQGCFKILKNLINLFLLKIIILVINDILEQ